MFGIRKKSKEEKRLDRIVDYVAKNAPKAAVPYEWQPPLPGNPLCLNILEQEHVLIAGTTGSGKSVLLNSIIFSGIGRYQFVLIDPKMLDLREWSNSRYCVSYSAHPEESLKALEMVRRELWRRINSMPVGCKRYRGEADVVVVIDEMAILLSYGREQVIRTLAEIMRLGRAAGIHIIAATQAPNRGKGGGIPAELQQCFTASVGLRCRSAIESRQVIGVNGCEALPRYGKGIYWNPEGTRPVSIPMTPAEQIAEQIRRTPKLRW